MGMMGTLLSLRTCVYPILFIPCGPSPGAQALFVVLSRVPIASGTSTLGRVFAHAGRLWYNGGPHNTLCA